jgi:hypothetical protein
VAGKLITLADFRPSPRADGAPWTEARIEQSEEPGDLGTWTTVETVKFEDADEDPTQPALRSFTVSTESEWLRIVFLDAKGGEDQPSPEAAAEGVQYRPTLAQVSAILRARTFTDQSEESGEFDDETRPTAGEVERDTIPKACQDVALCVGKVPGEMLDVARGVTALRAAAEIERSYLPEQAEGNASTYVSLRYSFDEEIDKLCGSLQLWLLSERPPIAAGPVWKWWLGGWA